MIIILTVTMNETFNINIKAYQRKIFCFQNGTCWEKFDINDERIIDYANLKNDQIFRYFQLKIVIFVFQQILGYGLGVIFNKQFYFFYCISTSTFYTNPKHIFYLKYFSIKKDFNLREIFENKHLV